MLINAKKTIVKGATPLLACALLLTSTTARAATHTAYPAKLVVFERFGAAMHTAPSSDASVVSTAPCGVALRVLGVSSGWYRVSFDGGRAGFSRTYTGWIGGSRVADIAAPPTYDCTDSYIFQPNQHGYSYVQSGCLSLRTYASRQAPYHYCVKNFHDYTAINGPISVGSDDWFEVTSPSTGSGWVIAAYLLPYNRF